MKKKKYLIIFLSFLLIILGMIIVLIYLKTDYLKSNKQLFLKYLIDENKMWSMVSLNQNEINSNKLYTTNGTIDFIYEYNSKQEIEDDKISKEFIEKVKELKRIETLSGNINSNIDKINKKENYNLELLNNESNIMKFEFIKDNDKYAFKTDKIMKAYIGLENDNLNEFTKKMGISDNFELIPDKINFENILKAFCEISDNDKEHIYETYKNIVFQTLDNKKYRKEKNKKININNNEYNTDVYTLELTKTESIELITNIIKNLKQDSITLNLICNKIKLINPESKYTNIKNLSDEIDNFSDKLNQLEKTDNEFIKIDVYANNNLTKKIDVIIENSKQITFEYENKNGIENLNISQNNLLKEPIKIDSNIINALLCTKKIKFEKNNNHTTYQFVFYNIKDIYKTLIDNIENGNIKDQAYNLEELKKIYNFYKEKSDNDIEISFNIELFNERENEFKSLIYFLIYDSKIGIEINAKKIYRDDIQESVSLNAGNSLMLNNYSKESIEKLFNALYINLSKALNKKI